MYGNTRIVLSCFTLWLPFIVVAKTSSESNADLILILPIFATLPAIVMAYVIFSRVEKYCEQGLSKGYKYIFVPLSGVACVLAFKLFFAAPYLFDNASDKDTIPAASWNGMGLWIAASLAWGIVWLVIGDIMKWLGVKSD